MALNPKALENLMEYLPKLKKAITASALRGAKHYYIPTLNNSFLTYANMRDIKTKHRALS